MKVKKLLAWTLFSLGILAITFALVYPITTWYWSWIKRPANLYDPLKVSLFPIPKVLLSDGRYADIKLDDYRAWFPSYQPATVSATAVKSFFISIPRLKMNNVEVEVNGVDLQKKPIHYPGSALPGNIGNSVVLGHSALPQYYFLTKNLTVFNPLINTKIGDEVYVNFNNINYKYVVNQIFEVTPEKTEVLYSNSLDRRQLSLITCVPLGTYLRRLVIVSDLAI